MRIKVPLLVPYKKFISSLERENRGRYIFVEVVDKLVHYGGNNGNDLSLKSKVIIKLKNLQPAQLRKYFLAPVWEIKNLLTSHHRIQ
jgi:hypothetical protein